MFVKQPTGLVTSHWTCKLHCFTAGGLLFRVWCSQFQSCPLGPATWWSVSPVICQLCIPQLVL